MVPADGPTFVPESVIVFLLRHAAAFEWACINCQCRADLEARECRTPAGKWQQAQGETGLDFVGRLATPRHQWFVGLDSGCTTVILEAKGDRTKPGGTEINRPAYNEMTGSLAAFFLSNLARIRDHPERTYGWLVPTTFHERAIEDFREGQANLALAVPQRRAFLLGTFDGQRFWRAAPPQLRDVAREWLRTKEARRNMLLRQHLGRMAPDLGELAELVFRFEVVTGTAR